MYSVKTPNKYFVTLCRMNNSKQKIIIIITIILRSLVLLLRCVFTKCASRPPGQLISPAIYDNRHTHTYTVTGARRQSMAHAFYYYVTTVSFFSYILCAAPRNNVVTHYKTQFGFTGGGYGGGDKPHVDNRSCQHVTARCIFYNVKTYYDSHLFVCAQTAQRRFYFTFFPLRVSDFPRKNRSKTRVHRRCIIASSTNVVRS